MDLLKQIWPPALDEPLVYVDTDGDSIPGIPAVVQVIAVLGVVDIHIIVFVPVVFPVFWPWVNDTEPKAAVLEAGIPPTDHQREAVDVEPVILTEVAAKIVFRNTVAAVAATLLPAAVLSLPSTGAMLLPHGSLIALMYTLPLL